MLGTADGDWVSMARAVSDGSYGVAEGLISSLPVHLPDGEYEIVQGLDIDDFSRERIDKSVGELADERDAVKELGLDLTHASFEARHLRNLDVVLSARTLPPVWQVGQ